MTIGEHLEFSVLTAPIASIDRRALSQAWYSALYGNGSQAQNDYHAAADSVNAGVACKPGEMHAAAAQRQAFSAVSGKRPQVEYPRGGQVERRAPRSALARKIERTFLHPRVSARKASFSIDGAHGRVQILLQSRGPRMRLIAICPPKAERQVAAALAQARYALAARGIALDAQTRGDAAW
jgi:hypothetical protein